ncbi:hypothetical protein M409DRAFT_23936 [Zasmidium cellare ATCC 36951]|uniref:Uncharacterized protein n=1 Tax=Zasmidium cellare ATCC 36951 TaxID=1080233 RepID=A0A6A6CJP3_ZASCE|nr:uncharacterized protein M409DRAFT_23936 [Zasmidium cellare ATCC 36951]KAF2165646.1 hypothetical protein M409DRAFT_23936 [Zasmidium cellare ATCC 36951]
MSVFIAYDTPSAASAAKKSKQSNKVLFVDCNEGGKPSEQSKARLNRHAALKSSANTKRNRSAALHDDSNQYKATSGSIEPSTLKFRVKEQQPSSSCQGQEKQKLEKGAKALKWRDVDTTIAKRLPSDPRSVRLITNTPYGAFRSPSPNVDDKLVTEIINWFFLGKEEATSRGTLQIAADHWMKQLWDWAVKHEVLFEGVVLNVMKKRIEIAGDNTKHQGEYLRQKGQIIRRLRRTVENEGPELDSPTIFVIANMAIHAFQDGDARAARLHLEALEAIKAPERIPPYEWVGVWLVDFRLALILGCKPAMSYYLPYDRDNLVPDIDQDALKERISDSMDHLPESSTYDKGMHSLVRQMWQFYLAWPSLAAFPTEPLGIIYNLEFTLRTFHADLLMDHGECEPSATVRRSLELALYGIQSHLWIVARHWEPLSWGVRMLCLRKALSILTTTPDFVKNWIDDSGGSPSSLIWILSTLTVFSMDEGEGRAPIPVLSRAAKLLGISSLHEFLIEMKRWPWLKNWHAVHFPLVWEQIEEYRAATVDHEPSSALWQTHRISKPKPRKLFVGAVEFYDI